MEPTVLITNNISELSTLLQNLDIISDQIESAYNLMSNSIEAGGKLLICGNGGSAADAQHAATELVVRYKQNRKAIAAIAHSTDTSTLTAAGNDIGFENIFSRQVQALAKSEDLVVGISTSGKSQNVINAIETAKVIGAKTLVMTGIPGEPLSSQADAAVVVPSSDTPRIQEAQILIWHILCDLLERDAV